MNIISLGGFAIITAVVAVLLRQQKPEYAVIISICSGILIIAMILSSLIPAISEINSLINLSGISSEYGKIIIKSLGICFITQFAADTCRDANETALASKLETAGKIAVLLISLPMIKNIAELAVKLIENN